MDRRENTANSADFGKAESRAAKLTEIPRPIALFARTPSYGCTKPQSHGSRASTGRNSHETHYANPHLADTGPKARPSGPSRWQLTTSVVFDPLAWGTNGFTVRVESRSRQKHSPAKLQSGEITVRRNYRPAKLPPCEITAREYRASLPRPPCAAWSRHEPQSAELAPWSRPFRPLPL